MTQAVDPRIANMDGAAAIPRKNGELTFEAPWQARAMGLAIALSSHGVYPWDDFRAHLIAEIGEEASRCEPDDGEHETESPATIYYRQWLASLEHLLLEQGRLDAKELGARVEEFARGEREEVY